MANPIEFKPLNGAELNKALGKTKTFSSNYPKKTFSTSELNSKFKTWQKSVAPPQLATQLINVNAVSLKAKDVQSLRAVTESPTPTAEAIAGQKMNADKLIGTLFTSLTTLEFIKIESEYARRLKAATTPAAKATVEAQWQKIVKGVLQAFAAAGLKGLNENDLHQFSKELSGNKANFNAIVNIANTGVVVPGGGGQSLSSQTVLKAGFVPQTGVLIDNTIAATSILNLCSKPLVSGSFTRHFHKGFSLVVRIPYPCGISWDGIEWCHKNVTLAGLSFDLDVQVGYSVTCCGAVAYGQASAQVCGTILGFTECAGCTAQITGVAGFGRTGTGSGCTYGLGINAELKCTFAGYTIFDVQAPFGFNINGPCPPVNLCGLESTDISKVFKRLSPSL
jgi:hypothetical protein